jgi:hypothetical protein
VVLKASCFLHKETEDLEKIDQMRGWQGGLQTDDLMYGYSVRIISVGQGCGCIDKQCSNAI